MRKILIAVVALIAAAALTGPAGASVRPNPIREYGNLKPSLIHMHPGPTSYRASGVFRAF